MRRSDSACDLLHYPPLIGIRFAKNRMKSRDNRHLEPAQQHQNMTAGRAAKNSVFVLQAYQIEVREIQELGSLLIGGQIILRQRESYPRWVGIPRFRVVDRHGEQPCRTTFGGNRFAQVGSKSGDPTLARKIVANDGDPAGETRARLQLNGRLGRLPGSYRSPVNKFECSGQR